MWLVAAWLLVEEGTGSFREVIELPSTGAVIQNSLPHGPHTRLGASPFSP